MGSLLTVLQQFLLRRQVYPFEEATECNKYLPQGKVFSGWNCGRELVLGWIVCMVAAVAVLPANGITLVWDPSPDESVTGYKLYYGTNSGNYIFTNTIPGQVSLTSVSNFTQGFVYYFIVTAYDTNNVESDPSNEAVYMAPTSAGQSWMVQTRTGLDQGATYQWCLDGINLPNATNSTYSIASVTSTNSGIYSVIIRTTNGMVTNAMGKLTLMAATDPTPGEGPPFPPNYTNVNTTLPSTTNTTDWGTGTNGTNSGAASTNTDVNIRQFVQPGMPPEMTLSITDDEQIKLAVLGTAGAQVELQSSTNIYSPSSWKPVTNLVLTDLTMTNEAGEDIFKSLFKPALHVLVEPLPMGDSYRFYRVAMPFGYPILASKLLQAKGYETHLIAIQMPGIRDLVVCYVTQQEKYLDYYAENAAVTIVPAKASTRDIATKVSQSLSANWTSASEFIYVDGVCQLVNTVVQTDPPAADAKLGVVSTNSQTNIRIDF